MTKVGFIGAGDISLLHAEGVQEAHGAELTGLWNRTRSRAEEKGSFFGCEVFDTPEELVDAVDVVYVLTNMATHHQYSMMAIEKGKHVLVEKPTAVTIDEILEMKDAAAAKGVKIAPVHNYVYEPGVMRAKELIASGKLGDLVAVYVLYNIHHPEEVTIRYPGVIRQILTHHAYCTLYAVGEPVKVSCMKATINDGSVPQENIAMATLQMKNGALSHLCASFAADDHAGDPWTFMIKVIGTKGATRYSYRDWVENTPAVVHSQTYSAYPYTIRATGRHFIEEVIGKGEKPLSTLDD
ncbi:MAG: Gfo/Idh/MocA family oxidoreductase, partial [Opitutales bacterium]